MIPSCSKRAVPLSFRHAKFACLSRGAAATRGRSRASEWRCGAGGNPSRWADSTSIPIPRTISIARAAACRWRLSHAGSFGEAGRNLRGRFEDGSRASGRRKRRQIRPTAHAMARSRALGERDRGGSWPDPSGNLAGTFGDGSRTVRGRFEGVWAAEAPSAQADEPRDGAEPCGRRARPEGKLAGRFGDDSRTSGRRKRGQTTPATSAMAPGGAKPGRALGFAMRTWPG